jgi:riboflavin synthase alpha subunit
MLISLMRKAIVTGGQIFIVGLSLTIEEVTAIILWRKGRLGHLEWQVEM